MNRSLGIIGGGFVGQILKKYYPQATIYDINGSGDPLDEVLNKEIIFIAFNLKDNGLGSLDSVREYLAKAPSDRIFVIKSTFVPGTTDKLQDEFPQHRIMYNPEFLTEATAWWDFTNPHIQILGIPHIGLKLASEIFSILPDAPVKRVISPKDAELLKHATNSYYATKLIFFNQLNDISKVVGADYETIRESMANDPRIGDSHNIIQHKGYRGYGGKCLRKDIRALNAVAPTLLLTAVDKINDDYRAEQKLPEEV